MRETGRPLTAGSRVSVDTRPRYGHPTVLLLPAIERVADYPVLPANLYNGHTRVRFPKDRDDCDSVNFDCFISTSWLVCRRCHSNRCVSYGEAYARCSPEGALRHAHEPQADTCSVLPWPHPLNLWSFRQPRGDSELIYQESIAHLGLSTVDPPRRQIHTSSSCAFVWVRRRSRVSSSSSNNSL